ncbi:glutamate racemase [Psychrobacter sp.]|uniref:glutamate racemase n=1 Tax=Psychrobacter sp. TaxID=56811 RepID=UPI002647B52E|nr:glutamate racemase [Psychrobacter sp.]MDN6276266.1 glutamate racemase [Psychrobacter sp.]MDN6308662.1 glutamate racemase [Psychrobacter sp.]
MDTTTNDMTEVCRNKVCKNKVFDTKSVNATATNHAASNDSINDDAVVSRITSHKDRNAPIGLFDSGVGGLSVYLHLAQQLPSERYIYYADTLNVPYGNRESEDIETLTLSAVAWLYQQGCKLIVIACNSASAYALEMARRYYPQLPIVGLVPALKPAVLASNSGHVAVLATKATLNGTLLSNVIDNFARPSNVEVVKYFDPQLVPWVEAGMPEQDETAQRLRLQLAVFSDVGVDQLVLGCTHYPFFKAFLLDEIARQELSIQVIDSGQAIAERVKQLLFAKQLFAVAGDDGYNESPEAIDDSSFKGRTISSSARNPLIFYATRYDSKLGDLIRRLLGKETVLHHHTQGILPMLP